MLLRNKVSSFSLVEMLVVLILSSMVVTILYFSYYMVSTYQLNLSRKSEEFSDVSALYFLLKKDFDRSHRIDVVNEAELHCEISGIEQGVTYVFSMSNVLRKQHNRSDTFQCLVGKPVFLWQGKAVREPTMVDMINLPLLDSSFSSSIIVYKQYDAASLIQHITKDTIQ